MNAKYAISNSENYTAVVQSTTCDVGETDDAGNQLSAKSSRDVVGRGWLVLAESAAQLGNRRGVSDGAHIHRVLRLRRALSSARLFVLELVAGAEVPEESEAHSVGERA